MKKTLRKKVWFIAVCCLLGSRLAIPFYGESIPQIGAEPEYSVLFDLQPSKDAVALPGGTYASSVPHVIVLHSLQCRQSENGKYQSLHGAKPFVSVKPKQAHAETITYAHRNIYPVEYYIYFMREIII